ncbi:HNH endonuclease [Clostridia bacterium]|nr:HNH endonuclease [Clostridia bacterium]
MVIQMRRKLTKAQRHRVYDMTSGHCAYCGYNIEIGEMAIDHVEPLALGGADEIANMLPACRSCNHFKSTMTIEKFRKAVERWPEVLLRDSVTYRNAVRFGLVNPKPHNVRFFYEYLNLEGR